MALRKPKHYHLISHVVFQKKQPIYGPIHVLEKYLLRKNQKVSTVFLPLTFEGVYTIQEQDHTQKTEKIFSNLILKYVYEMFFVFSYLVKKVGVSKQVVVAVDPLNCFPSVIVKMLFGYHLIYYTADYTTQRFSSPILNWIYRTLDTICMKMCDENWCVSSRIVEFRTSHGYQSKAKFLPNTPLFDHPPQRQKVIHRHHLIYVGRMDDQMNLPVLLNTTIQLHRKNPQTTLTLIGGGSLENKIQSFIQKNSASSYIQYLGPLENSKVIQKIKQHGIGVALYSGGNDWNNFGDSMKIREYQYFGLPVVTTGVPSNSQEIEDFKSGIVLDQNKLTTKMVAETITTITENYSQFSKNTVKNAQARLKEDMLDKLLVTQL